MPATEVPAADAVLPIETGDRHSRDASLTLAFAPPGDTLLYLLLPLHHEVFGVSLAEAGLLLAANRLVRIPAMAGLRAFMPSAGHAKSSCTTIAFAKR